MSVGNHFATHGSLTSFGTLFLATVPVAMERPRCAQLRISGLWADEKAQTPPRNQEAHKLSTQKTLSGRPGHRPTGPPGRVPGQTDVCSLGSEVKIAHKHLTRGLPVGRLPGHRSALGKWDRTQMGSDGFNRILTGF